MIGEMMISRFWFVERTLRNTPGYLTVVTRGFVPRGRRLFFFACCSAGCGDYFVELFFFSSSRGHSIWFCVGITTLKYLIESFDSAKCTKLFCTTCRKRATKMRAFLLLVGAQLFSQAYSQKSQGMYLMSTTSLVAVVLKNTCPSKLFFFFNYYFSFAFVWWLFGCTHVCIQLYTHIIIGPHAYAIFASCPQLHELAQQAVFLFIVSCLFVWWLCI